MIETDIANSAHFETQRSGERRLTALALAFDDEGSGRPKVTEIRRAVHGGSYRIPARVLAACLMLEMLRPRTELSQRLLPD